MSSNTLSEFNADRANHYDPGEPEEVEYGYDDAQPAPVLSVDVINATFAQLKLARLQKKAAILARIDLEAGSYSLSEKSTEVKRLEAEADCALDIAKAEVDRLTLIQNFFQLASLNNLNSE